MKKRILAWLLLLAMLFQTAPVYAGAAQGAEVSAGTLTLYPNGSGTIAISAKNFSGVASLDVYITYDSRVLTVTGSSAGSFLRNAQTSINTATPGQVKLSTIALNGLSGSGTLLYLYVQAAQDAPAGEYPISVAIGDAYDTMLSPTAVSGVKGSVTVNAPAQQEIAFRLYGYTGASTVSQGDTFTYYLCNSYNYSFASADVTITYDPVLFAVEEVTLDSNYANENAIYSINTATPGQIRITYASTEGASYYYISRVDFRVIGNQDATSRISSRISNIYREDLVPYKASSHDATVYTEKLPEVPDYPDIWLENEKMIVGKTCSSDLILQRFAGVAAADFTVTYDPAVLRCVSVTAAEGIADVGGMIVINDHFTDGQIRFSYVNMDAYDEADIPLIHIVWEPISAPASHHEAAISGKGVVDVKQKAVTLDYVGSEMCVFGVSQVEPTCTHGGYTQYRCACGEGWQENPTPPAGHSHESVVTAPTCTEDGYTTYTCHCGDSYVSDYVEALGHTYETVITAPTCTEQGYTTYTCHCGDSYVSDYVDALGHNYETVTVDATCTEDGMTTHTCTACGDTIYEPIAAYGHTYESVVTAPTCTEQGYTTYTCHCGDSYVSDYVEALGHNYETVTVDATCTEDGMTTHTCTTCGDTIYEPIAAYGHTYETVVTAPTCTEDGMTTHTCTTCGDTIYEPISAYGHTYETVVTAPTCTEQGYTTYTCHCGDSYVSDYVDSLGHSYETVTVDATCTEDGMTTHTCTTCGDTIYEPIAAYGHTYESVVTAPTCTEQGYTTYTCHCGDSYVADYVEALGHSYETVTEDATCTEDGMTTHTCTTCGDTIYEPIAAYGHTYESVVTAPTCTEKGYTTYTCHCGDSYVSDYVEALGHNYETVTEDATCTEDGMTTHTCTTCGDTIYEPIAAYGHTYETVVTAPTCTEDGMTTHTCTTCGDTIYEPISAYGHTYETVVTAPTCTEQGYTTYTCHCGDSYVSDYVEALDHRFVNGICGICGEADPDFVPMPMVTGKGFTLSFEDEILVNLYFTVSDVTHVVEQGMLMFYTNPGAADYDAANAVFAGKYVPTSDCYIATTDGIAAKEMGDNRYYCAYAKLTDGTYAYSPLYQYSPRKYANNMLNKGDTSPEQKALCVAMLNYGAAAQQYFGYKTDDLMNVGLTAAQQALVKDFDASYFKNAVKADESKIGAFASTNSGFGARSASVSFEGAFSINYYFATSMAVRGDVQMYIWTPGDYAAAQKLTAQNASAIATMVVQPDGSYWAQVTGIAAKNLDKTYYVAGVYTDANGNTHCTGVIAYSLSRYCLNNANGPMGALAQATAMYGYYADAYFA